LQLAESMGRNTPGFAPWLSRYNLNAIVIRALKDSCSINYIPVFSCIDARSDTNRVSFVFEKQNAGIQLNATTRYDLYAGECRLEAEGQTQTGSIIDSRLRIPGDYFRLSCSTMQGLSLTAHSLTRSYTWHPTHNKIVKRQANLKAPSLYCLKNPMQKNDKILLHRLANATF